MPQFRDTETSRLDIQRLAEAVEERRLESGLSLRQLAQVLELAPSTLTRLRQGGRPDAEAAVVLMAWAGLSPQELLVGSTGRRREPWRRPERSPRTASKHDD